MRNADRGIRFVLNILCVLGLAATPRIGAQAPAAKKPMTLVDLANLQRIVGAELSPDGKTVVYGLSVTDWKAGRLVDRRAHV